MHTIFSKAEEIRNSRQRAAICIVIETRGSTPRKQGSKMIVYEDGTIFGSIGGGSVEKEVAEKSLEVIALGKPVKCSFNLDIDLGMHCGGFMEVYIEPINPSQKLYIFGGGHIGKALIHFAQEFDFSITVFDPREGIFNDPVFTGCTCMEKDYFEAIDEALFDDNTYIVIVTPKHIYDEDILVKVVRKPHAYVGMIGSRRKVEQATKRFLDENLLTAGEIESIDMPMGIKFNAQTPQEIAISILAKLIDVRNHMISPPYSPR
ncbi:MAG: XdhC family protein [Bacteroidales bacterium]